MIRTLPALTGVYVGTTFASSWQDRVVRAELGLQSNATASLHPEGVLIERDGADAVFRRLGSGDHGAEPDTGPRADDKSAYPDWVRTINGKVTADA